MAIHMKSFQVDGFRGIRNLKVNDLNHINIIAGDNNSGKTSVLESLLMFENFTELTSVVTVAKLREGAYSTRSGSFFEGFLNMFGKDRNEMCMEAQAVCDEFTAIYKISGTMKKIYLDANELKGASSRLYQSRKKSNDNLSDVSAFSGQLIRGRNGVRKEESITIHEYTAGSMFRHSNKESLSVMYMSPMSHITGDHFDVIIRNDGYKGICIEILKIFDSDIQDLLYLKDENTNGMVECVKHKRFGNMPLNTYGDGIKKVLSLANALAKAKGGILLIDEVETAIHAKHYNDIFSFLIKAAIQFDVQIFVTTHSIEAIDGFLMTQKYEEVDTCINKEDYINVITFKKTKNKTHSRVLSGRQAYQNRENFDFEVRL